MDVINSLLRAARAGNLKRVLELVEDDLVDINSCNANGLTVLHSACKEGHTRIVEELLARGANVHAKTLKGNQPIHIASLAGHEPVVRLLLDNGADVNAQSTSGFTSLYMAAQENHESIVRLLLERGADQNISTTDGFTPLAVSLQQNHENIAKILLSHEARGQVRFPGVTDTGRSLLHVAAKKNDCAAAALLLQNNISPDVTSKSNFTSLHVACHYGNEAVAKLLIDNNANVDFQAKQNITPMHVAARWNQPNMVNLLLDHGARIDAKTKDHLTPLHCAARMGHNECVELLIKRGAPISAKTRSHLVPLHMAAQGNHLRSAQILLNSRAPVDDVTIDHLTSLHVASHCGHVKVAKLLLDHKAEPNLRAQNGFTSLHIACKKNHLEVVKLLLKYGASLMAVTESGLSCLHIAAFMGCVEIVAYLLDQKTDIEAQTIRGETPLILATRANQLEVIEVLLRYGANVNAHDQNHQNALHLAARLGNAKIARSLIERGVNIDAPTRQMYTALHIASKENHEEMAALLLDNGANIACATRNHEFFPLHLASKYGNEKIVQLLLNYGAPVDAKGKNDVTSLMVASHYDHPRVVELLQMFGASPHATAKNGYTAIHIAAKGNRLDCAHLLLQQGGANPNVESKAGFCPLHLAAQEGRADMAALLLDSGAHVNCRAKNGITPLHLCAQEDHVNVAQLLVKYGAQLNAQTKNGFTPLHVACHFARMRMIRFLLANGADVNIPAASGYTSLHQASQQGNSQIVDLLLQYNARPDALTEAGHSALDIAEKLHHVSVIETLRIVTETVIKTTKTTITEEKFKIVAPETMQETFVSDSEDEADDTPAHQESVKFLTTDVMRSFNSSNMADDNLNTSQSNLQQQQQHQAALGQQQRADSLQELNEELAASQAAAHQRQPSATRAALSEMQPDLQYLAREAPLDGGESTFGGAYSTLGQRQPASESVTQSMHTYSSTITATRPHAPDQENDYEHADFRLDQDELAGADSMGQLRADSAAAIRQASSEALERVAPDNVDIQRPLQQAGFLVSFMVDARGGAMRGCRHSGVRVIIPPGAAQQPMRITCRYLRRERLVHPPPLMEGEACASKIMEVGPAGAKFLGPVLIEVPHFASLRGREREIIILRSDSGEVWREHLVEADERLLSDMISAAELAEREQSAYLSEQENTTPRPSSAFGGPDDVFATSATNNSAAGGDPKQQQQERRLTRIVTNEFPQYFAIISRIRQEVHTVGPEGSAVDSQVVPKVQAIFTEGALTKRIKIGLQKKTNPKEAQSDQEEGERTPRARSPMQAGSPAPSGSRPSSAAAKRRSRFLACFGASHGSQEPLGSATDGELASGSSANSSAGGDSPRQLAKEKRVERRHIIEDVSDSEREDSGSLGPLAGPRGGPRNRKSSQLVPDDYYLEPDSPLILNLSPKTYGKRMASSAAQTDSAKLERLSTSTRHDNKRRGLLGGRRRGRNKTQMTLPLHEPTSKQLASPDSQTETGAADSSLESALGSDGREQPNSIGTQIKSFLKDEPGSDAELKCLTRTIQTDSDSVTVHYVTIYGASGAPEAVEAAANSAASQKGAGQDDGYVSGSGELKRQEQSRAKGLFSPFCAGSKSQEIDDSSIDDDAALKVNEAGQLDVQPPTKSSQSSKTKPKKWKQKKSAEKASALDRSKSQASSEKLEIVLEAKTPELASTAAESASGASSPTLQAAISPELPSGAEDADESLLTSRSISPTSGKESKAKLKAEKAEKAKREKLERQKQKELEEAEAKAEKARKKLEKEAKRKAAKELRAQTKADSNGAASESGPQTVDESSSSPELATVPQDDKIKKEGFSFSSTIAKTIQSVKFAPSPSKSAEVIEEPAKAQQQAAIDLAQDKVPAEGEPESAAEDRGSSAGDKAHVSPAKLTKQVIDSMSSKFKVKLPKLGGSKEAPQSDRPADDQPDESMVHMSIGESSLPARDVSFEDEQQLGRKPSDAANTSTLPPAAPKALRPILKQQSTTSEKSAASAAEISIGEPVKSLSSIADQLVSEATEEAVRAADELAKQAAATSLEHPVGSPASESSESKKELAKRVKTQRDQAKKEAKLRAAEEKQKARELEELVKKAEEAAKRAEREAKVAAQQFAEEAEKQAKIAKAEAERAVLEAELAEVTASVVAESSSDRHELSHSELKKRAKSAEAEAKRVAKEAKEEAKRLAKEAEAEAKQKSKEAKEEAKRLAKEAKQKLKLDGKKVRVEGELSLPTAPSIELADNSISEPRESSSEPAQEQQVELKAESQVVEVDEFVEQKPAASQEQVQAAPQTQDSADDESPSKSKSGGGFGIKLPSISLPKLKGAKKSDVRDGEAAKSADERPDSEAVEQQLAKTSEEAQLEVETRKEKEKKSKKAKKDKAPKAEKSGSSESLESSSRPSAEPASKSSIFSRLFKSKSKPKAEVSVASEEKAEEVTRSTSESLERAAPQSGLIVSEMYPSDPNDSDGEMILEVNVPENMIGQQQQRVKSQTADGGQFGSTVTSSSGPAGDQLDDQEATLVNMSQLADEAEGDDDEATENVLSQATNDMMELGGEQRRVTEQEQLEGDANAKPPSPEMSESAHLAAVEVIPEQVQAHQQHEVVAAVSTEQHRVPEAPHEGAIELKSEKSRKQLEAKLEKEAKKRAAEEEKLRKKEEKEAKKLAEAEAKRAAKEAKERAKRESKDAKRLAELAKKEAKEAEKAAKKNKAKKQAAPEGVEIKTEVERRDEEPRIITSTAVLSSSTTTGGQQPAEQQADGGEQFDEATGGRVLMSVSSGEVPVGEETEVERIVEEEVGEDGTVTKRTKLVETKYVTLRQEEVRAIERRDIPADEWAREQAAEAASTSSPEAQVPVERSPASAESGELEEIRAVPSYFDPDLLPAEIKPETALKKVAKKRAKLNQRLIKRAYKLARREANKAKVGQKKAEAEIAVSDEAARRARKQLKRAVEQANKAVKEVAKAHKKMDKMDKKLSKQAKKLDKRQKKIDKELEKAAKKADKKREKEAKKAAKKAGKSSRSSSRSSKRSIKAEDISEPVLRSSSRLSIGRQQSLEPAAGEQSQTLSGSGNDLRGDMTLDHSQHQIQRQHEAPQPTQEQIEQMVRDGQQVIVHSITKTVVNEAEGEPEVIETTQRVLTGREAEEAAMRMELEAARDEEEEIDVVGVAEEEPAGEILDHNQENQTPTSTPDISQASTGSGGGSKSKKNKKKRNKRQKSEEAAE